KSDSSGKDRFRIAIDFRALNEVTLNEFHPLPNIIEILDQSGQCQLLFTILDLATGFYQILLAKISREMTAFSTGQGHIISEHGIKPDSKKITSVLEFLVPKTDVKFNWDENCQIVFDKLKNALWAEPIIQYPDFTKPFILTTDASGKALGAILSQGTIGSDLPIAYASKTLNKSEMNYLTTELECSAIVYEVKQFRLYHYGRKYVILTDHRPLSWLFNLKDPLSKLTRWRIQLKEYDYKIKYKPGVQNSNVE
ncbi:1-phosphatidylinositol 4,5-bisphosphate phosphodiesterase-like, partial [Aphis craccivora]